MRSLYELNRYRMTGPDVIKFYGDAGDDISGMFKVPLDFGKTRHLLVIAAADAGWDHVSVSIVGEARCPTWNELEHVKRLFFKEGETAMQLHVPEADHINVHPYCLHLWRPWHGEIPRPPGWMVGLMRWNSPGMTSDEEEEAAE